MKERLLNWVGNTKRALQRRWWLWIVLFIAEQIWEVAKHRIYGDINAAIDAHSSEYLQHAKPAVLYLATNPLVVCVVVFCVLISAIVIHAYVDTLPSRVDAVEASQEPEKLIPLPPTTPPSPTLVILRAVYGVGPQADIDITESLRNKGRDGLVIPVDNNLVPYDPAIGVRKRLVVEYSYGDGVVCSAYGAESMQDDLVRVVIPEGSETRRLKGEVAGLKHRLEAEQPKPAQYPVPSLRSRVVLMVSELQGFLGAHGQEPIIVREPTEAEGHYQSRFRSTVMPWRAKFLGDFRLKFGDSLPHLQDEIRLRAGIDDYTLNSLIVKASTDPNGNVKAVEALITRLWELALMINA